MINRRRWLLGGTAVAAVLAAPPIALHAVAARQPAHRPVSDDVVAWVKDNAVPLATAEPGSSGADLASLRAMMGDARVVAMGEATHGTREFFQLKHRVIEYCVTELGFNIIAFEALYGSTLAVNDYVLGGKGSATEALARGLRLDFWNTEEVLALVEWVRAWNARHDRKVKFYGFDMQWAPPAARHLVDYLRQVAPDLAAASEVPLAPLLCNERLGCSEVRALAGAARVAILTCVKTILSAFDAARVPWINRSSDLEWHLARLSAVNIEQNVRAPAGSHYQMFTWRDRCMADNVRGVLEAEGPHAKVLLWAHNAHVQRARYVFGARMMGGFLHSAFGAQQVV